MGVVLALPSLSPSERWSCGRDAVQELLKAEYANSNLIQAPLKAFCWKHWSTIPTRLPRCPRHLRPLRHSPRGVLDRCNLRLALHYERHIESIAMRESDLRALATPLSRSRPSLRRVLLQPHRFVRRNCRNSFSTCCCILLPIYCQKSSFGHQSEPRSNLAAGSAPFRLRLRRLRISYPGSWRNRRGYLSRRRRRPAEISIRRPLRLRVYPIA